MSRGRIQLRILITGATGFAGQHLVSLLRQQSPEDELHGTRFTPQDPNRVEGLHIHTLDLRNPAAVHELIGVAKPDQIYHLAAQAQVRQSFDDPWFTLETNIRSELNLIQACLSHRISPRIMIVSTGELYASAITQEHPADENTSPNPSSPYAVSKLAQELLALQYFTTHNLPIIIVRPFNQLGPGQREGFVAVDFAMQIARIEAGQQKPQMKVGNLDARRDFTDVRDVARAKQLLMQAGASGEIYNIASGQTHQIREILNHMLAQSYVPIEVLPDPERMRPANVPLLWGDSRKLRQRTGWEPGISLQKSLSDILADCRVRVRSIS